MLTKQKYFEFLDKPQKLLSRQLCKLEKERAIHRIKSNTGELLTAHKENLRIPAVLWKAIYFPNEVTLTISEARLHAQKVKKQIGLRAALCKPEHLWTRDVMQPQGSADEDCAKQLCIACLHHAH